MDVTDNFKMDIQDETGLNVEKIDAFKQVRNVLASDGIAPAAFVVTTNVLTVYINGKQYQINVLPL